VRLAVLEVCREVAGYEAVHLVTRETGQAVRSAIAQRIVALASGTVATLDFTGVGIVDFSCADECLAKLLTRLIAGEYGVKYLRLSGLGDSQRENIHVALERKRLPALLVHPDATWDCLGTITPHLRETLTLVMSRPGLSARELAGLLDLELTAASTRLGSLHRQRLVRRHERPVDEGGREYVYEGLNNPARAEG
jgi:DNA-binding MarR family transcriptional regulator